MSVIDRPSASSTTPEAGSADLALARAKAPILRFCDNEPFLPSHVGISLLDKPGRSPSATLDITFEPGVARVIEYAIWWDWDVQHLYELEHVWLKLDADNNVVGCDASGHGKLKPMRRENGELPLEDGRIALYSEPGKHAFHAEPAPILANRRALTAACTDLAGIGTILVNEMFDEIFTGFTRADHRLVKRSLQDRAFLPAFTFPRGFALSEVEYLTWPELHAYIAERVPAIVTEIRATQPALKAIFLDSGDTMVDEGTEQFDADGYVTDADLIPGALEMVEALAAEGYKLVLMADGRQKSFDTVLGRHGIKQLLDAEVISEIHGCQKPDKRMFEAGLAAMDLGPEDAGKVVMIGNHLGRDIRGANALGLVSVWLNWSPRRYKVPLDADEVPDFVVRTPGEIPQLLALIEQHMSKSGASDALRARSTQPLTEEEMSLRRATA